MANRGQVLTVSGDDRQGILWVDDPVGESPDYLTKQLITYIGNKRSLLGPIGVAVERVKRRLGKARIRCFDVFSGSGVVSRFLKAHSSFLVSNDIEDYAAVAARCYLRNGSTVDFSVVNRMVAELNCKVVDEDFSVGFLEELYAPRDEACIRAADRVFYTRDNARRLDNYRRLIESLPVDARDMFLGPLLSKASIHVNTAGVFKGFYKDRQTKVGQYGGSGGDALSRIRGQISLEPPILSQFECDYEVHQGDANAIAPTVRDMDLAYIDPPYNQHPYGSNYFMLNLLVRYERPTQISRVSGIPNDWQRSDYNKRARSLPLLRELLCSIDARYLLVSFNNEGFISPDQMGDMLREIGSVEILETRYNAFRGSRSFKNRSIHVTEQLFLVERR